GGFGVVVVRGLNTVKGEGCFTLHPSLRTGARAPGLCIGARAPVEQAPRFWSRKRGATEGRTMKVVANVRKEQGSGASRRLRRAGYVPGIVYGGKGEAVPISVEHNPLYHAL